MRDLGTLNATNITYEWLISVGVYHWSVTSDRILSGVKYSADIRSGSFTGMETTGTDPTSGTMPPHTCSFSVMDPLQEIDVPSLRNAELTVMLVIDGGVESSWAMRVKSANFLYGEVGISCEDYWQHYLDRDYPYTRLISGMETAVNVQHAAGDDDKACVPIAIGSAYAALRSVWSPTHSARVFPLGLAADRTYTITEMSTPPEMEGTGVFPASTYTMEQVTIDGIRCLIPHITSGPGNVGPGFFQQGEQLLDAPTKYSTVHTYSNDPAYAFALMLLGMGCPIEKINMTKIAESSAIFIGLGMAYGYAHTRIKTGREIISQLLISANATIKRTDQIWIEPIVPDSVLTVDRERITNSQGDQVGTLNKSLSFNPDIYDNDYDGGTVAYWPDKQGGDPTRIEVGVTDSPVSVSGETLEVPFFTDTVLLQRLGRLFYRRMYWRVGQIGFPAAFDLIGLEPWDTITIDDSDIYGGSLTCVITSVSIGADLTCTISGDAYSQPVGGLTDWTPAPYNPATAGGNTVPGISLFPVSTVAAPTIWDDQLTVDGQQLFYWFGGDLWVRGRNGGTITSIQITGV